MFLKLFLLFVGLPLIELYILIQLGSVIGLWPTLTIVVTTGFIGATLARYEGFRVIQKINAELKQGRMPAESMVDGVMILVGGIVLLTPGILTDLLGFSLLIPSTRAFHKKWIKRKLEGMIRSGETKVTYIIH